MLLTTFIDSCVDIKFTGCTWLVLFVLIYLILTYLFYLGQPAIDSLHTLGYDWHEVWIDWGRPGWLYCIVSD